MREKLKKKRLQRIDAVWVRDWRVRLEQQEERPQELRSILGFEVTVRDQYLFYVVFLFLVDSTPLIRHIVKRFSKPSTKLHRMPLGTFIKLDISLNRS